MFKPTDDESKQPNSNLVARVHHSSLEVDELIPRDGKDEKYDEVVAEINELESSLNADLKKFRKSLGYVIFFSQRTK